MTETNNYNDSHDVTTTTTTTTVNNTSVDSHDTNVSLINGGIANGSLNNILSGNTLVNLGDVLSGNTVGDVLSNNQILSPTVNVGDVNLGLSDVVHDVLNPSLLNNLNVGDVLSPSVATGILNGATTAIGSVLSPSFGDVLSNLDVSHLLNVADVGNVAANVLPIAGDVLGNVDIADLSHLTSNIADLSHLTSNIAPVLGDILPISTEALSHIADGNVTNIPVVSSLLSGNVTNIATDIAPTVTDVLGHVANGNFSGLTADLPVVASVLNDVGSGSLDHVATDLGPSIGDVLSHIGSGDLSGLTANIPTNIAAPITGIFGDIAGGAVGNGTAPVVGDVLSHIADAGNIGGLVNGSIGDVVAHIASIGGGDLSPILNITDIAHNVATDVLGNLTSVASGNGIGADLLHNFGHADLSDVGAVLNGHGLADIASSHLDLDHLTSNLNLFDTGHVDTGADIHHS